jgi:hypothetical protein
MLGRSSIVPFKGYWCATHLLKVRANRLRIAPHDRILSTGVDLCLDLLTVLILIAGYKEAVSPAGDRASVIDPAGSLLLIEIRTHHRRTHPLLHKLPQ